MARSNSKSMKLAMNLFERTAKEIEISRQNKMDELPSAFLIEYLQICIASLSKLTEAVVIIDKEYLELRFNQITKSEANNSLGDDSPLKQ